MNEKDTPINAYMMQNLYRLKNGTEEEKEAYNFLTSPRGTFIISQALCVAIETLNKVEPSEIREQSNISDMEFLRDSVFDIYKVCQISRNEAFEHLNPEDA